MTTLVNRDIRREVDQVWSRLHIAPSLGRRGPVQLAPFLQSYNLLHVALPNLSREAVFDHLGSQGIKPADVGDEDEALAGFLFVTPSVGLVFVNASDPIVRQRFTAAHELGHYVLHRGEMSGTSFADIDEDVNLTDKESDEHEREANRFAVELLMPEEVCRVRETEMRSEFKACPRLVLAYRLASELLVSREAMRYRLDNLELGDED